MRKRLSLSKLYRWGALISLVAGIVATFRWTIQRDATTTEPISPFVQSGPKVRASRDTALDPMASTSPANNANQISNGAMPEHETDPASPALWKRVWDPDFLANLDQAAQGDPISFELVANQFAKGTVRHTEYRDGELIFLAGELTEPETGRFFFQKQTAPGVAGDFAGVVELPARHRAYRIEPSGPDGTSELVEMSMSDAVCTLIPPYNGPVQEEIPLDPSDHPDDPVPSYQDGIVSLQSFPGATGVLYIDYRGGYTPTWGGITYQKPNVSNAQIRDVWKRVAEDFMPFKINVTTDIQVYQAAAEPNRQRVICTPTTTAAPGAGGVAYLNSWNWTGDTPCWSFYSTGKSAAEVISHEVGHTLTLRHDGRTTPAEGYFSGQGSGAVGWAPIMGVGYYKSVAQWSKGEYTSANNTEDDLVKIVGSNNGTAYRDDDTGITLDASRYMQFNPDGSAFAEGVIETSGDADAFRFKTTGGAISLRADPAPGDWANLAIQATLHDSSGTLIASNNPQGQLWASISATLASGSYTFRVTGAGRNNRLTDGFSSYGSLGYYSISGTAANIVAEWTVSAQAILSGDGKPDLVWRNPLTGRVITWLMDGTTTLSTAILWPATNTGDSAWVPLAAGDFNADGKSDLIWRHSVSGRVIVWFMDGVTHTSTTALWPATNPADAAWVPMLAGDFNADGKPDLVWRNSINGRVNVWLMNGVTRTSTTTIWAATNPGDSAWVPAVSGDFNADGKPDLLWRHSTSGRVIVWFMNGVTRTSTGTIWAATNPGDSAWVPQAGGDFNTDGKPDLVWRHLTSGRVIIWFMNGITRTSTTTIWNG